IEAIKHRQRELGAMRAMVDQAIGLLTGGAPITDFGRLLHESWLHKRALSSAIAPAFVDEIYERARRAGACGGKLLGAGGGGFMLFCVAPERRRALIEALGELIAVPVEFETAGSQVVFQ